MYAYVAHFNNKGLSIFPFVFIVSSKFAQKRGGIPLATPPIPCCTICSPNSSENSSELLDEVTFQVSCLYLELVEIPHSQYMISPIYLYNLISNKCCSKYIYD